MYLTTNVLGKIGATGAGHKCQQHSRGGVATTQIDSYSTLLASPHFTVATNITSVAITSLDTLIDNYSTLLASPQ